MRTVFRLAPVLLVLVASPSTARAHSQSLITLLSHFHEEPGSEQLAAFEPDLEGQLVAIAEDGDVPRLARLRALSALGRLGDFETVSRFALEKGVPLRLRLGAVLTLGQHLGARPETLEVLSSILSETDPGLREHAVRALARIGTPEAFTLIHAHRAVERHAVVRSALREARRLELRRPELVLPPEGRSRTEVRR